MSSDRSRRSERKPTERESGRASRRPWLDVEPLEPRLVLSAPVASAAPPAGTVSARAVTAALAVNAPAAVSMADRWALADALTPDLGALLKRRLRAGDAAGFDQLLLDRLARRDGGARFYYGPADAADLIAFAGQSEITKAQLAARVSRADQILAHVFPEQVNSATYTVRLPAGTIDWLTAPTTTTNPNFLYSLNRHTYWSDLASAYRATGDRRYVREMVAQLQSWAAQNPPPADPAAATGPAWQLLTTADRVTNWVGAYFLVLGSKWWSPEANTLFLSQLAKNAAFLAAATPSKLVSNQALVHAAALAQAGEVFPEFAAAATWEYRGRDLMYRCLGAQFYPDGGHVEESPSYHGVAVAALLDQYQLDLLNGRAAAWGRGRRALLTRAVEAYFQFAWPDGRLPAVSDTYRSANPISLLSRAAAILRDRRYVIDRPGLEDLLILGRAGFDPLPGGPGVPGQEFALPDAGYYVIRGDIGKLTFDAGPKGGTHGHLDLLNFELDMGRAFGISIADPGPFGYDDSPERAWALSTPAHNTISIDGLSHAPVEGAHNPKIVVDEFRDTGDAYRVTAHHYAYDHLAGAPIVGRSIAAVNYWYTSSGHAPILVADFGTSGVAHAFTSAFNLPGGAAAVTQLAPGVVEYTINTAQRVRLQTLLLPGQTTTISPIPLSVGAPPAKAEAGTQYRVTQTTTAPLTVTMVSVYTYAGREPHAPLVASWEAAPRKGRPLQIRITDESGEFTVVPFTLPALAPLAAPAAAVSAAAVSPTATPPAVTPALASFSTRPIAGDATPDATPDPAPDPLDPAAAGSLFD